MGSKDSPHQGYWFGKCRVGACYSYFVSSQRNSHKANHILPPLNIAFSTEPEDRRDSLREQHRPPVGRFPCSLYCIYPFYFKRDTMRDRITSAGMFLNSFRQFRIMLSPSFFAAAPDSLTHLRSCRISLYFCCFTSCLATLLYTSAASSWKS